MKDTQTNFLDTNFLHAVVEQLCVRNYSWYYSGPSKCPTLLGGTLARRHHMLMCVGGEEGPELLISREVPRVVETRYGHDARSPFKGLSFITS